MGMKAFSFTLVQFSSLFSLLKAVHVAATHALCCCWIFLQLPLMLLTWTFCFVFCKLNSGSKQKARRRASEFKDTLGWNCNEMSSTSARSEGVSWRQINFVDERWQSEGFKHFKAQTFSGKVEGRWLMNWKICCCNRWSFRKHFSHPISSRSGRSTSCSRFAIDTSSTVQEMGEKVDANARRGIFYSDSGGWVRRGRSEVQQPLRRCTRLATLRKMIYCVCRGICVRSPCPPGPPHRKGALFIVDCRSPLLSLLMIFVPFPQNYVAPTTPFGGWRWDERNFHFCVITKTAIETSQGKCTRLKSSTEFSPRCGPKINFSNRERGSFQKLCRSCANKKIKTNNKKDKDTRGTINFLGAFPCTWKRREKRGEK